MKRSPIFAVLAILVVPAFANAAGFSLDDIRPVKGDRTVYKVFEQNTMTFENTPVTMSTRGTGTETTEVIGESKGSDKTIVQMLTIRDVKTTNNNTGKEETTKSYSLETCRTTPFGLWVDSNWTWDGDDSSVDVGQTFLEMKVPCDIGASWVCGRLNYKDGFSIKPKSDVVSREDVDVPAGSFKSCLKVVSTTPDGAEGVLLQDNQRLEIVSGSMQITSWYYPHIGLVKEITATTMRVRPEGGEDNAILRIDTATTTTLQEYKLGKR